jgi:hypothetical protein
LLIGVLFLALLISQTDSSSAEFNNSWDFAQQGLLEIQVKEFLYFQLHCEYTTDLAAIGFEKSNQDPYEYEVIIDTDVPPNLAKKIFYAQATVDLDQDGIIDTWTIYGPKADPEHLVYDKED